MAVIGAAVLWGLFPEQSIHYLPAIVCSKLLSGCLDIARSTPHSNTPLMLPALDVQYFNIGRKDSGNQRFNGCNSVRLTEVTKFTLISSREYSLFGILGNMGNSNFLRFPCALYVVSIYTICTHHPHEEVSVWRLSLSSVYRDSTPSRLTGRELMIFPTLCCDMKLPFGNT